MQCGACALWRLGVHVISIEEVKMLRPDFRARFEGVHAEESSVRNCGRESQLIH